MQSAKIQKQSQLHGSAAVYIAQKTTSSSSGNGAINQQYCNMDFAAETTHPKPDKAERNKIFIASIQFNRCWADVAVVAQKKVAG